MTAQFAFLKNDTILVEDEDYLLRPLAERDKSNFIETEKQENVVPKDTFDEPMFVEQLWRDTEEDCIFFSIIAKAADKFCGFCNLRRLNDEIPEIGISLQEPFRYQGIGVHVLPLFMQTVRQRTRVDRFLARVYSDNTACLRLMEKLGGVQIGTEPSEYMQLVEKIKPLLDEDAIRKLEEKGVSFSDSRHIIHFQL